MIDPEIKLWFMNNLKMAVIFFTGFPYWNKIDFWILLLHLTQNKTKWKNSFKTLHPIPWLRISCSTSPGLLLRCDHFLGEWVLCPLGLCMETGLSLTNASLPHNYVSRDLVHPGHSRHHRQMEVTWRRLESTGVLLVSSPFLSKLQSEKCSQTLSSTSSPCYSLSKWVYW